MERRRHHRGGTGEGLGARQSELRRWHSRLRFDLARPTMLPKPVRNTCSNWWWLQALEMVMAACRSKCDTRGGMSVSKRVVW